MDWCYLDTIPGKGLGVLASRRIPAFTRIATYPGKIYNRDAYKYLVGRGTITSLGYAFDLPMPVKDATGKPGRRTIIDPTNLSTGKILPQFARSIAPRVNEPSFGQTSNVAYVENPAKGTVELYTTRVIQPHNELVACYGPRYGNKRDAHGTPYRSYVTPCVKQKASTLQLQNIKNKVITRSRPRRPRT